jgi:hypothetical protein
MTDEMPRPEPRPVLPPAEPRELGWGEDVVIEDGAELFFPWLRGKRWSASQAAVEGATCPLRRTLF